jgi:hypothetical protein
MKFFGTVQRAGKKMALYNEEIFAKPSCLYAAESRFDHRWLLSVSGFCAMVTITGDNSLFNVIWEAFATI